ncbi:carbamoyltransferase family protein [Paenibacillus sp. HW567]|uniref:carbamoyltransferase family protein n=1 Tax=Paenibacillus sp. HW567 TaxID=1034769 RepID=UPI0003634242|nr:carbamoyltransferase C-terminal domain-containing protein [Paenibacillus sp. HW567]
MYIMGINSVYHESSACLMKDGVVIAAVEEERFNRKKHGKELRLDNPHELPLQSISYCLKEAGITLQNVDHIGYSINPARRLDTYKIKDYVDIDNWGSEGGETEFYLNTLKVEELIKEMGFCGEFHFIDHHICHGASAFFASPYEEAAVVVIDGIGETATTLVGYGKRSDHQIVRLDENLYPASLGFLWEKLCMFLGFSEYDACKVMGLSSYVAVDPLVLSQLRSCVAIGKHGKFTTDPEILRYRQDDFTGLEKLFGIPRRQAEEPVTDIHTKIAAALQAVTEEILVSMVNHAYDLTGSTNLCMAGGVALNCVANGIAFHQSGFQNLYIQPAANDAGTAMGAAYTLWNIHLANYQPPQVTTAYLGPQFTDEAIEATLVEYGLTFEKITNIEERVAQLLADQNIVGWFQGRMEFGPRALGNRSLLADPRVLGNKERMNRAVKKREDFRPFAPSVLDEDAEQFFIIPKKSDVSDYMLITYKVKSNVMDKIPAVVHVDGTSRIQTVKKSTNPRYYSLIEHFKGITGVPMLLNTSFNDNEPIVCNPEGAIRTFLNANIDYLAIGDYLIKNISLHQGGA